MSKTHAFRPTAGEALEDRAVPTGGFGGGLDGLLAGLIQSVPAADARLVLREFRTFEQTYAQDVRTILLPTGTTNPSTNRAAFDAAIATALGTLNSAIDADIQNLPTAAALTTTIRSELLGTGSTTLQSQLAAVASPTTNTLRAEYRFGRVGQSIVERTGYQVGQQVRTAPAPTGGVDVATLRADLVQVNAAFRTYQQSYNTAVNTVLLPAGTTNPSTNRAAFDTAVGTALTTLNTSIASALGNLPTSVKASLATTLSNDLLTGTSTTGTSLQARLAALTTPTSARGFSPFFFRVQSSLNVQFAQGQVYQDIIAAARQFNTAGATTGGTTTP